MGGWYIGTLDDLEKLKILMTQTLSIDLPTEQTSEKAATRLAQCLTCPLVITFSGEIGAGKTTFIRALLKALGVNSNIKSPTFSLVESYQGRDVQIHHFDLYRIHDENELDYIGFSDYFSGDALCCIEWPERAQGYRSLIDIKFILQFKAVGRKMHMQANTALGAKILSCFERKS